ARRRRRLIRPVGRGLGGGEDLLGVLVGGVDLQRAPGLAHGVAEIAGVGGGGVAAGVYCFATIIAPPAKAARRRTPPMTSGALEAGAGAGRGCERLPEAEAPRTAPGPGPERDAEVEREEEASPLRAGAPAVRGARSGSTFS